MVIYKLTDAKCKPDRAVKKQYEILDGESLYLAVTRSVGKHWRVAYRVESKAQTYCMGLL